MFHICSDEETQIASVVVRVRTHMSVAEIALIGVEGSRIGDTIMHLVGVHGSSIAWPKQHADDPGRCKTGDVPKDVFCSVILIMSRTIIQRVKILIPDGHLPQNDL